MRRRRLFEESVFACVSYSISPMAPLRGSSTEMRRNRSSVGFFSGWVERVMMN